MNQNQKMPLWVLLAYASISSRKVAINMIIFCFAFTLYCAPWTLYLKQPVWIGKIFLLKDWDWFGWSLATTLWYWFGMKWLDRNGRWECEVTPP